MATADAAIGGAERQAAWYISGAAPEQWHHLAITWTGSQGSLVTAEPTVYLNGVSSSLTTQLAPYNYYDDAWRPSFTFKGHASVTFTGDNFLGIGTDYSSVSSYVMSGTMDEISLWKRPITSAEVTNIYNGGVPCDITRSIAYTGDGQSGATMFDWIRCGELGGSVNNINPAILDPNNIIKGFVYGSPVASAYMPIALSGSVNLLVINATSPAPLVGCTKIR